MCHTAMSAKGKKKATHVLCIYFKGRSQPKQAHPVSTCPEYKWHFLPKVDHLIMSAKYLKNIFVDFLHVYSAKEATRNFPQFHP